MSESLSNHFKDKTCLITGGAGSLGRELAEAILDLNPHSVRILDNNEQSLARFRRQISDSRLRFLFGNVQDKNRVEMAVEGVNIVFHLAAAKMIDICDYNPIQAIGINVGGTINMLESCLKSKPQQFIFVSSDKAVNCVSTYGATKQIGEHLTLWAQKIQDHTKYSVFRPCNFEESEGNVFEIWMEQLGEGEPLTITSPKMQRFMMPIKTATKLLLDATMIAKGGEIFVPETKEYGILELAKQFSSDIKVTGLRGKEKLKEEIMTHEERQRAKWNDKYGMWVVYEAKDTCSQQ